MLRPGVALPDWSTTFSGVEYQEITHWVNFHVGEPVSPSTIFLDPHEGRRRL